MFSAAVTKHLPKATWLEVGGTVYLTRDSTSQSVIEDTHGRISRQEPGAEIKLRPWWNDAYWIVASDLLTLHSYTAQAHLPRNGTAHSGWNPPVPISHQENTQADTWWRPIWQRQFLNWLPSSLVTPVWSKLTSTKWFLFSPTPTPPLLLYRGGGHWKCPGIFSNMTTGGKDSRKWCAHLTVEVGLLPTPQDVQNSSKSYRACNVSSAELGKLWCRAMKFSN